MSAYIEGVGMTFSREDCYQLARKYIRLAAFYRVLGNARMASGYLNSAHYWRRKWTLDKGMP